MGRCIALAAVLALCGHAGGEAASQPCQASNEGVCDEHTSLLQAFTSLDLRQKAARVEATMAAEAARAAKAAAGIGDASSFAQAQVLSTVVRVARRPVEAAPEAAPREEDADEDAMCSLEGLTPGVCVMAAFARTTVEQPAELDVLNPKRLERALFSEMERTLAGTHAAISEDRVASLEQELSSLFAALPKNEAGLLGHAAVRYALHQRFLRQHAWYVRSLNPAGEAQAPASPWEALRGRVPEHLQELLEERQGGRGLGLSELTALVATLEHLIEGDVGERLKAAYAAHRLSHGDAIQSEEADEVLKTFMAHFLSLAHRSGYAISPEQAWQERSELARQYDGWFHVTSYVQAVLRQKVPEGTLGQQLRFPEVLSAAKEVMERYESYSAEECHGLKQQLAAMPNGTTGRVRLADLHEEAVSGSMQFAESTEYLTTLGAVDSSDPASPVVLIPNYIYSPSNCLGTTSFFDLCCPNECETILEDVEQILRASEATAPEMIRALERRNGWKPPASVLAELEEAARERGGRLALHGFALARWLHRAFPRECPRPRAVDFGHHSSDADELPDAQREFQAVAAVGMVSSKQELLEELQEVRGNASATAPLSGFGSPESAEDLRAVAAKALGQSAPASTKGLRISAGGLDGTSLAQAEVETEPAAEESV